MTFNKAMIDLAKEIRRRAPADLKPTIKMANPELFVELGKIYQDTGDAVMKALIKEICELAGEPWSDVLVTGTEGERASIQTYRGSTAYQSAPGKPEPGEKADAPKRIYRGQVVSN